MGFIEHRRHTSIRRHLDARDYIWLATLGSVTRGALPIDDVAPIVAGLAGPLWAPTGQLIADAIDEMVVTDLLGTTRAGDGQLRLTGTIPGRARLHDLLVQSVHAPLTAFGQVGVRIKLAFLDLLPAPQRQRQIEALTVAYECEIAGRSGACPAWAHNGPLGRLWLDAQVSGLEDGLALLRRLAREP